LAQYLLGSIAQLIGYYSFSFLSHLSLLSRMNWIDWLVLLGTLGFIAAYGVWKTRRLNSLEGYLKGNDESWATIGLSVMATQASAITFLSVPGQAYEQGLGFVQFYFGMPIALVILSITFIPMYYRLKVYTAYEYLEHRFDLKNRLWLLLSFCCKGVLRRVLPFMLLLSSSPLFWVGTWCLPISSLASL